VAAGSASNEQPANGGHRRSPSETGEEVPVRATAKKQGGVDKTINAEQVAPTLSYMYTPAHKRALPRFEILQF